MEKFSFSKLKIELNLKRTKGSTKSFCISVFNVGGCLASCLKKRLDGFLSHLVTSFQAASCIAGFTWEILPNIPYEQISTQQSIFHGIIPHMVYYVKFSLMAVGSEWILVIFVLSFRGRSVAHTQTLRHQRCHKMCKFLVYHIN